MLLELTMYIAYLLHVLISISHVFAPPCSFLFNIDIDYCIVGVRAGKEQHGTVLVHVTLP